MNKDIFLITGICLTLGACGGSSSSSDNNNTSNTSSNKTGVFLDSPVINIGYRTETLEGVTNNLGEYEYIEGETVTFYIGDLELPAVTAKGTVTPLDIASSQVVSNSTVINIIRLLQSLDKDGNPDNGIIITDAAKSAATQVDFSLDEAGFESSTAVTTLLVSATDLDTPVTALISTLDAIAHFEQVLDNEFAVNMTQKTASSVMTFSSCPNIPLGWRYTFTSTSVTFTGSDTWDSSGEFCVGGEEGTFTVNNMASPFDCAEYPICTTADFNKTISGVDQDDRDFTSTYSFDRETSVLTYVKLVEGTTFTEVITIE